MLMFWFNNYTKCFFFKYKKANWGKKRTDSSDLDGSSIEKLDIIDTILKDSELRYLLNKIRRLKSVIYIYYVIYYLN